MATSRDLLEQHVDLSSGRMLMLIKHQLPMITLPRNIPAHDHQQSLSILMSIMICRPERRQMRTACSLFRFNPQSTCRSGSGWIASWLIFFWLLLVSNCFPTVAQQ
jgi:hypothetical protein